jgi:hypothetical protein
MANDQKKGFTWEDDDRASAAPPVAGGKKPFVWSDEDAASNGLSPENLAANKARNAQPTQFEQQNSTLGTANRLAGKALSAAGLPNSISDIPNWTAHLAGQARDSKPFWQPFVDAAKNPTQENLVGAVPLIGAPSVEMSRDVRAGRPLDAAATLAGTIAAPFAAKEISPGLRAAKMELAESIRTPENKLTPITREAARAGATAAGHAILPGAGGVAGALGGPAIADRVLPRRIAAPDFYGGAYEEPAKPFYGPDAPTEAQLRRSAKMAPNSPDETAIGLGGPLPSSDEFYENRGSELNKIRQMNEANDRRVGRLAKIAPPTVSPEGLAAPQQDVIRVPEPRDLLPGEKVGYNASTPRKLLLDNALQGRPGAAEMLRNAGKTPLFVPESGYAPPKERINIGSPLAESPFRIGSPTVEPRPQYQYRPSEKASTMSADRPNLGPEFETSQVSHEIERNKSILRNPLATAEDRSIAQSRLRDAQAMRGRE